MYISTSYAPRAFLSLPGQAANGDLPGGGVLQRGGVAVTVAK